MAQSTLNSYNIVGTREDLSDLIAMVTPTDTPFSKMCRKGSASSTLVEWQMDGLAAAATNAQIDGNDAPAFSYSQTTTPPQNGYVNGTLTTGGAFNGSTYRAKNYTQIAAKTVDSSGTTQATTKAGRGKDELARLIKNKTLELKRDIEYALVNYNNVSGTASSLYAAGASGTARQTMGLVSFLDTNYDIGATGVLPSFTTNTARTAGTARAFSISQLKNVVQQVFQNSSDAPDTIMVDPATRVALSAFTDSQTRFDDAADKTLTSTVQIWESDFGTLKVVANRFQPTAANVKVAYVLNSQGFELAWLRPLNAFDLAKTGDYDRKEILGEFALKVDNTQAHGTCRDLT